MKPLKSGKGRGGGRSGGISVRTNDDERVPNGPKAFTIVLKPLRVCPGRSIYLFFFFVLGFVSPSPPHEFPAET